MALLVVDVGTTHCKAGLFAENGDLLHSSTASLPRARDRTGATVFALDTLWQAVTSAIDAVTGAAGRPALAAVGVASMAETGLLLSRDTGAPRTALLPWFDTAATPQSEAIAARAPELERWSAFGIHPSFKCSLAKILWAREQQPDVADGAVWLGAADYVVYRLCGALATDPSLAGRTYAYNLRERAWDDGWLREFDLSPELFPPAPPSGTPLGHVSDKALASIGIPIGTPVAIGGHDHICAAFGAGVAEPGQAFDSMGTAEALLGALDALPLDEAGLRSGLTFGIMPASERWYWLGGLSSSGGALDWLRGVLGDPALSYAEVGALQQRMAPGPGDLLFLPYLAGSGAPYPNQAARGAFVGLGAGHTRADMLRAVLEGTAYQMESIRRAAVPVVGRPIDAIVAAGGGARLSQWMQIKADIYGTRIASLAMDEATLFGTALIAGIGCGVYGGVDEALAVARRQRRQIFEHDHERHRAYARRFEREFQLWQRYVTGYTQGAQDEP